MQSSTNEEEGSKIKTLSNIRLKVEAGGLEPGRSEPGGSEARDHPWLQN